MRLTYSLTAALGLLLLAPALAHQGHPRHISMEYSNAATKEAEINFTNAVSDLDTAAINLCEAKDPLPADWQDGPAAPLTTAKQCKKAPVYPVAHDYDLGAIVFNVPQGKYTYLVENLTVEPGDYVVSVALYKDDESSAGSEHHDRGLHSTLKKVTLELPDDEEAE